MSKINANQYRKQMEEPNMIFSPFLICKDFTLSALISKRLERESCAWWEKKAKKM